MPAVKSTMTIHRGGQTVIIETQTDGRYKVDWGGFVTMTIYPTQAVELAFRCLAVPYRPPPVKINAEMKRR